MLNEDVKIKNILGKTGAGKSLICVEDWFLPALLDKEDVHTCLWLNWKGYTDEDGQLIQNWHYFAPRNFEKIKNLRNCVIGFDEYRQSFDPRRYDDETEEVRAFFELHRHRHNDIRGNTQDVSLVAKTIGIQAHEWSQVERVEPTWLQKGWDWLLGRECIRIRRDYLTFAELKKMANGWELGEDVGLEAEWEIIRYDIKDLLHHELDEYKQELVHRYCPKCKMRQGEQIKAEDTEKIANKILDRKGNLIGWELKEKEYCPRPNHKHIELELKESGMFDTDYEPEVPEEQYRLIKMVACKTCGKEHPVK